MNKFIKTNRFAIIGMRIETGNEIKKQKSQHRSLWSRDSQTRMPKKNRTANIVMCEKIQDELHIATN